MSQYYLIFQSEFKTGKEAYQKLFKHTQFDSQVLREGHSEEWTTVSQILASFPLFIKSSYGKKNKHVFSIIPKGHHLHWCSAAVILSKSHYWEIATPRIIQTTSYKFRTFPRILLSIICQANKMTAWGDCQLGIHIPSYVLHI